MAEYIDRKALDKAMTIAAANGKDKDRRTWAKAICVLHDMPTADVAPVVHGRWISWEKAENLVPSPDRHECSVCHDSAQVLVNGLELLSDYCPSCGAKMGIEDGGEKSG